MTQFSSSVQRSPLGSVTAAKCHYVPVSVSLTHPVSPVHEGLTAAVPPVTNPDLPQAHRALPSTGSTRYAAGVPDSAALHHLVTAPQPQGNRQGLRIPLGQSHGPHGLL